MPKKIHLPEKKMTLADYVDSLSNPKKEFLDEVKEKTGKSDRTIYNWLKGETSPSMAEIAIIEEIYKKYNNEKN